MSHGPAAGSIRRRLVVQLLAVAAVLSGLLYISVRTVAFAAVETTQDRILGAATLAIAEELRGGPDGVAVNIPYTAFSMLGAIGEDRVFYRIVIDGETATGYADLPLPDAAPDGLDPSYYSRDFQNERVRIAAVHRSVLVNRRPTEVLVLVAQTRAAQTEIVARMANRAAGLGLGFFVVAALLSILTARSVLQPVQRLAEAVGRRGPNDLRPVVRPVPEELAPLVSALNGFIARLSGALSRTETFIAEAAHHIRTPLSALRAQAEIALRQTEEDDVRTTLRAMIRAVDDSARSAGQLLDHATVIYRTDQRTEEAVDLAALARGLADTYRPVADMRDIDISLQLPDAPVTLTADRLLLESALRNMLDNAVKYSDPDSVVAIALTVADGLAHVRIADRGRGLSGVDPAELLSRFQRGTNVDDVVGSGLGLTIVSEVARAMGGRFGLTERQEGGICADLFLPLG
jgi:two-component system sensor histidine kinase TctE